MFVFSKVGSSLTAAANTLVASSILFEMISCPCPTARLSVWNYLLKPSEILILWVDHKDMSVYVGCSVYVCT